jgi:phosphoesterase RecJ-like protein
MRSRIDPMTGTMMDEEIFGKEFEQIAALIDGCRGAAILGHVDPDGDCIGSMLALAQFLDARGKEVVCYAPGEMPDTYRKLPLADRFVARDELVRHGHDVIFALDSPTTARLEDLIHPEDSEIVVNIDHHPTNELYGRINVVDENASATAILVFRFLSATAPEEISSGIADCLYMGILLDTGGFRFQNTNAEALATAARLVEYGARAYGISREFIYMKKLSTLKLLAKALDTLEIFHDGKVAVMNVTIDMVNRSGGSLSDTEGFVDYAGSVGDVELCALLREIGPKEVRVSLRSRDHFDVAALAERYGGGGHRNAAGLTLQCDLASARSSIVQSLGELLAGRE